MDRDITLQQKPRVKLQNYASLLEIKKEKMGCQKNGPSLPELSMIVLLGLPELGITVGYKMGDTEFARTGHHLSLIHI